MHHDHFTLYALPVDALPVGEAAGCREVEQAARAAAIARAELVGTYARWAAGPGHGAQAAASGAVFPR